ncbi:hypothetical protein E4T42_04228 [Aureobasidium subglaciale]|nr:hypothetical protein E4T42_04228 [Aureobasidium subglaciale]
MSYCSSVYPLTATTTFFGVTTIEIITTSAPATTLLSNITLTTETAVQTNEATITKISYFPTELTVTETTTTYQYADGIEHNNHYTDRQWQLYDHASNRDCANHRNNHRYHQRNHNHRDNNKYRGCNSDCHTDYRFRLFCFTSGCSTRIRGHAHFDTVTTCTPSAFPAGRCLEGVYTLGTKYYNQLCGSSLAGGATVLVLPAAQIAYCNQYCSVYSTLCSGYNYNTAARVCTFLSGSALLPSPAVAYQAAVAYTTNPCVATSTAIEVQYSTQISSSDVTSVYESTITLSTSESPCASSPVVT